MEYILLKHLLLNYTCSFHCQKCDNQFTITNTLHAMKRLHSTPIHNRVKCYCRVIVTQLTYNERAHTFHKDSAPLSPSSSCIDKFPSFLSLSLSISLSAPYQKRNARTAASFNEQSRGDYHTHIYQPAEIEFKDKNATFTARLPALKRKFRRHSNANSFVQPRVCISLPARSARRVRYMV